MPRIISPSVLSADFNHLGRDIEMLNRSEAEWIHIDVMDGRFVPNISFGFPVLSAIRKITTKVLDTHLMIVEPERYIERFAKAGADLVSFHLEAAMDPGSVIDGLRAEKVQVGLVINPGRSPEELFPYLDRLDLVLIMSVWAGFGGQSFLETSPARIETLANEIVRRGLSTRLQVDGGISAANVRRVRDAGADTLVAGTSVFGAADRAKAIADLRA